MLDEPTRVFRGLPGLYWVLFGGVALMALATFVFGDAYGLMYWERNAGVAVSFALGGALAARGYGVVLRDRRRRHPPPLALGRPPRRGVRPGEGARGGRAPDRRGLRRVRHLAAGRERR